MAETVEDVMTRNPITLSPTTTLDEAARAMKQSEIGAVIVLDDGQLRGIVTDRDIVVRAVADDKVPHDVKLEEICSKELTTIEGRASTKDAVKLMREKALRRLPVVDNGKPVGILSLGDLAIERDPNSVLADISSAPANT